MFFLYVVVTLFFLLILIGGYTFIMACVRRKELPWLVKEEIEKTPYGKYHKQIMLADQWLKDHKASDIWLDSSDGLKLHGLWIPAKNSRGTVLFAHGYRSTYLVDFSLAMDYYHNMGMNLLIPDQRAHGKSEGKIITFGVKESDDMLRWANYHNESFGNHPLILSGLSMGASTMMYLADQNLPKNVRGIIADCGFTSPKEIISTVFRNVTHLAPWFSLWATDLFARLFGGFALDEKDSRRSLKNSKVPVILFHGTADDFVPCEMSKQAYAVCKEPKRMMLVDGADHGVSFVVDNAGYVKAIQEFFALCGI